MEINVHVAKQLKANPCVTKPTPQLKKQIGAQPSVSLWYPQRILASLKGISRPAPSFNLVSSVGFLTIRCKQLKSGTKPFGLADQQIFKLWVWQALASLPRAWNDCSSVREQVLVLFQTLAIQLQKFSQGSLIRASFKDLFLQPLVSKMRRP